MTNKKTLVLAALVSTLGFSSVSAYAAAPVPAAGDMSSALIQWSGYAKVIPGDDIIITGARAGAVEDGVLTVHGDGTFVTKTPIDLESRLFWDQAGSGVKEVGDLFATNWTLDSAGVTASWGANSTAGMDVKMVDISSGTEVTDAAGPTATSSVTLSVSSDVPVTTPTPLNLLEPLVVTANVLATVA